MNLDSAKSIGDIVSRCLEREEKLKLSALIGLIDTKIKHSMRKVRSRGLINMSKLRKISL